MRKILDNILRVLLFAFLFFGVYILWLNFPSESVEFEDYQANISEQFPLQSAQFYNNMRYPTEEITYGFASRCERKKRSDVHAAIERIEAETIIKFREVSKNPQITITCSEIEPEPNQKGHFVAGEGGPTLIINATRYSVITAGQVSLFRADKCERPQIATHEILHALGFDHNSNSDSIMYPITNCEQEIDEFIIKDVKNLYAQKPLGDLLIDSANAQKSGTYLDFKVTISNSGLKTISSSNLRLLAEGEEVKEFEIGELEIGSKKTLTIQNLRIPRSAESITMRIITTEQEIDKDNNFVNLKLTKTE